MKLDAINFRDGNSWTSLKDLIYPQGCLFFTGTTDAPGELFGGTWAKLDGGAVLALEGRNGFANATNYGGNLKISIDQMPSHNHKASNDNWSYFVRTSPNSTITRTAGTIPSGSGGHYINSTTAFNGAAATTISRGG